MTITTKETTRKYTIGLNIIRKQINAINIQIDIGMNMSTIELAKQLMMEVIGINETNKSQTMILIEN